MDSWIRGFVDEELAACLVRSRARGAYLRPAGALAQKLEFPLAYLDAEEIFKEWRGRTYQELEEFGEILNGQKP